MSEKSIVYTTDQQVVNEKDVRFLDLDFYGFHAAITCMGRLDDIISPLEELRAMLLENGFYDISIYPSYDNILSITCKKECSSLMWNY